MLLFQLQEPYYTDLNRYIRLMRIGNVPWKDTSNCTRIRLDIHFWEDHKRGL